MLLATGADVGVLYSAKELALVLAPVLAVFAVVVWFLIKLSVTTFKDHVSKELETLKVWNTRTDTDVRELRQERKAFEEKIGARFDHAVDEMKVMVGNTAEGVAELRDSSKSSAALKHILEVVEGQLRRVEELRVEFNRDCSSRHQRIDELHDELRDQIDRVRTDQANLGQSCLLRSEFNRDRDTLLEQTRAIRAGMQEFLERWDKERRP